MPERLGKISAEFRVNFLECSTHKSKEIEKDSRVRRARNTTLTFYFLLNTTREQKRSIEGAGREIWL